MLSRMSVVLAVWSLYTFAVLAADDYQTWTDSSGQFKVEAKFLRLEEGKVVLEEREGKVRRIDLSKLSAEDQKRAQELAKGKPDTDGAPAKEPAASKDTPPISAEFRTWTDRAGKAVEARFLRVENGQTAVLQRRDGKLVKVALTALSDKDNTLALNLMIDAMSAERDRAREKEKAAGDEKLKEADSGAALESSKVDWTGTKEVVIQAKAWTAPATTPVAVDWTPKPVIFPAKVNNQDRVEQLLVSLSSKRVLAVAEINGGKEAQDVTRLILANAATGKYQRDYLTKGKYQVLDFAPDGKTLLVQPERSGRAVGDVELWRLGDTGIERVKKWNSIPERENDGFNDSAKAAHFLENGTKVLIIHDKFYSVMAIDTTRPLYVGKFDSNTRPTVSADGKYLFGVFDKKLFALSLADGVLMGTTPLTETGLLGGNLLAVSPDGKKIAYKIVGKICIYDLETGQEVSRMPAAPLGDLLFWTGPESLMAGGDFERLVYFDTVVQYPFWEFKEVEHVVAVGNVAMFYVEDGSRQRGLVVSPLPHAPAKTLVAQAKKDPKFFIVKPGTKFRVDASSVQDARLRQEFKSALEKRIAECGHLVDDSAALVMQVEMIREKDREVTYRPDLFGAANRNAPRGLHKVNVPIWVYVVTIKSGGEELWAKQDYDLPPLSIPLKENESLEQKVRELSAPRAGFFKKVTIPQYVPREARADFSVRALRSSEVTVSGVR